MAMSYLPMTKSFNKSSDRPATAFEGTYVLGLTNVLEGTVAWGGIVEEGTNGFGTVTWGTVEEGTDGFGTAGGTVTWGETAEEVTDGFGSVTGGTVEEGTDV